MLLGRCDSNSQELSPWKVPSRHFSEPSVRLVLKNEVVLLCVRSFFWWSDSTIVGVF